MIKLRNPKKGIYILWLLLIFAHSKRCSNINKNHCTWRSLVDDLHFFNWRNICPSNSKKQSFYERRWVFRLLFLSKCLKYHYLHSLIGENAKNVKSLLWWLNSWHMHSMKPASIIRLIINELLIIKLLIISKLVMSIIFEDAYSLQLLWNHDKRRYSMRLGSLQLYRLVFDPISLEETRGLSVNEMEEIP